MTVGRGSLVVSPGDPGVFACRKVSSRILSARSIAAAAARGVSSPGARCRRRVPSSARHGRDQRSTLSRGMRTWRPPLRRMQRTERLAEPSRRVIHWYYMATRTVRLDEESKRAPADVRRATGTSVSGALKRGLVAARDAALAGRLCTRARAAGEAGGACASTPQAPPVIFVYTARWSRCSTRATAPLLEQRVRGGAGGACARAGGCARTAGAGREFIPCLARGNSQGPARAEP